MTTLYTIEETLKLRNENRNPKTNATATVTFHKKKANVIYQ